MPNYQASQRNDEEEVQQRLGLEGCLGDLGSGSFTGSQPRRDTRQPPADRRRRLHGAALRGVVVVDLTAAPISGVPDGLCLDDPLVAFDIMTGDHEVASFARKTAGGVYRWFED